MTIYKLGWADLKVLGKVGLLTIPLWNLYEPALRGSFPQLFTAPWIPGTKTTGRTVLALGSADREALEQLLEFLKSQWLIARSRSLDPRFTNELDQAYCLDRNFTTHDSGERTPIGELEYQAKYRGDARAARTLADLIADAVKQHPRLSEVDGICAVPANPGKTGSHLPDVLVKQVSARIGMPVYKLTKTKNTGRVTELAIDQKADALANAFAVPEETKGRSILVIDDKFQSGSTMWSVATALRAKGAIAVAGFVAVKTWRDSDNRQ